MGVLTTFLKLLKPSENDYYNQQTEQADNWDKVDDYAVLTNTDKNGIWGGEYGGGLIEDPSVAKVVGKRYIGADGKAYICLVPSNVNNTTNYAPCNVVDNLNRIKQIESYTKTTLNGYGINFTIEKIGSICILSLISVTPNNITGVVNLPEWAIPKTSQGGALTGDDARISTGEMYVYPNGEFKFFVNNVSLPQLYTGQIIYIAKN